MPTDENEVKFTASASLSHKSIIFRNFVGGIFWGIGSVIGASLMFALIVGVLRTVNFVPIIGNFAAEVVEEVQQQRGLR